MVAGNQLTVANDRSIRVALFGLAGAAVIYPVFHVPLPCPLRAATGIPCPLCGMSRAVAAAAHGHLGQSLAFNPGGIIVVLLGALLLARPDVARRIRPPTWAIVAVFASLWVWNLGFNPTFHQYLLR
jgi:hypothetical protein